MGNVYPYPSIRTFSFIRAYWLAIKNKRDSMEARLVYFKLIRCIPVQGHCIQCVVPCSQNMAFNWLWYQQRQQYLCSILLEMCSQLERTVIVAESSVWDVIMISSGDVKSLRQINVQMEWSLFTGGLWDDRDLASGIFHLSQRPIPMKLPRTLRNVWTW